MSYAQAAASGPKQSPEEDPPANPPSLSRAPPVPEVEHTDDSTSSLIDVDSPHISSVPSTYSSQSVKTDTQATRLEQEASAKEKAEDAKERAKAKASRGSSRIKDNSNNPVVLGNAITVGVLGTVLGIGAYRKWAGGELSWKVVGAWAGVVGLFGVADYYVSTYLFQKYPPKK
ncbi:hypothetical protein BCR34DRAFT_20712 [Clohesyomyces aquaticus]|uniref:Uncharacterized protein n=1 Tax=Clohesyomyces aquaticus TaxID=1231657 RepID=A0A1Y1ZAU9_9PLEO|nr:hypothetical protein BCR34DRAFT_20712 [Clohesyomyces aquaticus]